MPAGGPQGPARGGRSTGRSVELLFLGGAGQRGHAGFSALDHGGHLVEVARAHLLLVRHEGVATLAGREFGLLHLFHIGGHAALHVVLRQVEHVEPHAVDAGQRDELVLVAHGAQFALELGDGRVVEVLLPVERRRAVVREQLARVLGMHGLGELAGEFQVRRAGLAPDQVRIFGIRHGSADGLVDALAGLVEAFCRALARQEGLVVLVVVAGDEVCSFGVGAGDDQGGHAVHVGGHACCDELLHGFLRGHQHLAAHVAALLDRSELVFEVHAGGTGADHGLHQLIGVQHAAEAGLGIGHDGGVVVDEAGIARVHALGPLDFVGAGEAVVDALHDLRHRVHGVQRLVGVHRGVLVIVGSHLPAGQVDRLDAGLDLLHGLAAGQRAEAVHIRFVVDEVPELFSTAARQRVFDLEGAAEPHDVGGAVTALDPLPAGVLRPVFFQGGDLLFTAQLLIEGLGHGHLQEVGETRRRCVPSLETTVGLVEDPRKLLCLI